MNREKTIKFLYRIIKISCIIWVIVITISCNAKGAIKNTYPKPSTVPTSEIVLNLDQISTLQSLKLEDNYPLYSMNYYGDYYFEEYLNEEDPDEAFQDFIMKKQLYVKRALNDTPSKDASGPAECSAFITQDTKKSYLYARNLDLASDTKHPALFMVTNPSGGYSSVSMVELWVLDCDYFSDNKNTLPPMEKRNNLLAAPFFPRDGVNECGFAISSLSAPLTDIEKDPNKKSIGRWQVIRLLLDHAKNVDEGITLIKKYNINMGDGSGVHYLLADKSGKSAVVEVINGIVKVLYNKSTWNGVTNFLVNSEKKEGTGQERYNRIFEVLKKKQGKLTEKDAMALLKDVSVKNKTVWSDIYNLSTGEIVVNMGGNSDKAIRFSLNAR